MEQPLLPTPALAAASAGTTATRRHILVPAEWETQCTAVWEDTEVVTAQCMEVWGDMAACTEEAWGNRA